MKHIKQQFIDWQRVCLNLRSIKPLEQIANTVHADGGTIRRLASGDVEEPKFTTGILLLDLHYELLPEKHNEMLIK